MVRRRARSSRGSYGGYGGYDDSLGRGWGPYIPVAQRRQQAAAEISRRQRAGETLQPVVIAGRLMARTVWGRAWCDHLDGHGDYANRLPRGRSYARNGSVIDLAIDAGVVRAQVSGSSLYRVEVKIDALASDAWAALCRDCAGGIDSLVELLKGQLAGGVLQRLCDRDRGMFPLPRQMHFRCSCPDGAAMCKHVAAALYGVGSRLDSAPELLFVLRQVDQGELVRQAAAAPVATSAATSPGLGDDDLSELFGLELDVGEVATAVIAPKPATSTPAPRRARRQRAAPRSAAKKATSPGVNSRSVTATLPTVRPGSAADLALRTLANLNEELLAAVGIKQLSGTAHSLPALRQGLVRLERQGLVRRLREGGGEVWWGITETGLAAAARLP